MTVNLGDGEIEWYDETSDRTILSINDADGLRNGKWWFTLNIPQVGMGWEFV